MDSALNIWEATTLPTTPEHPTLATFLSHTRAFLPKLKLLVNPDGIWVRSTTAALSTQCFFAAIDYFATFYLSADHPVIEIPILSHELDAVLSPLTSGAECAASMVHFEIRTNDNAHLHVSTSSSNGSVEHAIVRVCKPHPPFTAGDQVPESVAALPRLVTHDIYRLDPTMPVLNSTRNTISPKILIRTLRAHKAQRVNITVERCGRLIIASEYGGNARQSQLGGWTGEHTSNPDEESPRTYLSGLLLAMLKSVSRIDASRFRIDRECGAIGQSEYPLQLLCTLGHVSYIRYFVCDSSWHFNNTTSL
jgi:hypothetical protein